MKAIEMIGLVALAALLAMAFAGATSAMAESTVLCKADESPCSSTNSLTHVHETSVGKAKLLTSLGTTECNVLFLGDTSEPTEVGTPLVVTGNFTYSNCELAGSNCTATEQNGPAELEVLREGHETAAVTGKGLVHLVCGKTIDCSYNGTGLKGTAKGPLLSAQVPDNGEVSLSGQETTKEVGGFLCPKTAKLDITTSPLVETSLTTATTHYCVEYARANTGKFLKVNSTTHVCEEEDASRLGKFALTFGRPGLAVGTAVCVRLSSPVGLYNDSACTSDNAGSTGRYEKGTIR